MGAVTEHFVFGSIMKRPCIVHDLGMGISVCGLITDRERIMSELSMTRTLSITWRAGWEGGLCSYCVVETSSQAVKTELGEPSYLDTVRGALQHYLHLQNKDHASGTHQSRISNVRPYSSIGESSLIFAPACQTICLCFKPQQRTLLVDVIYLLYRKKISTPE